MDNNYSEKWSWHTIGIYVLVSLVLVFILNRPSVKKFIKTTLYNKLILSLKAAKTFFY